MDRGLAHIDQHQWDAALEDCSRAVSLYRRLVEEGWTHLTGLFAHSLLNRSEALHAIGRTVEADGDRNQGFDLMRRLIAQVPETRVVYLRKSILAVKNLLATHPDRALSLLTAAVREAERGLREGRAVDALRLEARRGLGQLIAMSAEHGQARILQDTILRLKACAGIEG